MSDFGDSMGAAIKRRIEKTDAPAASGGATDKRTAERLASEEAQRKAYEARQKREINAK